MGRKKDAAATTISPVPDSQYSAAKYANPLEPQSSETDQRHWRKKIANVFLKAYQNLNDRLHPGIKGPLGEAADGSAWVGHSNSLRLILKPAEDT